MEKIEDDIEHLKRVLKAREAKHKADLLKFAVVTLIVSLAGLIRALSQ